jgi:hypothetical protein
MVAPWTEAGTPVCQATNPITARNFPFAKRMKYFLTHRIIRQVHSQM